MSIPHPAPLSGADYSAAELLPEGDVALVLDQRRLPSEEVYVEVRTGDAMVDAIRDMLVRGAPAIGVAAAYGVVLAAHQARSDDEVRAVAARIAAARPTAVNLAWAVHRMLAVFERHAGAPRAERSALLADEARALHREDVAACRRMGELGAARIPDGSTILTHCNAGALATGGYGTALGVVRAAYARSRDVRVLACETRPYLQGARLTAWELAKDGIPVELVTDGMTGHFFSRGAIDAVVVGADRIARNGDVANKIGTYGHACLARLHGVPFYVAAPWSTVDLGCPSGLAIPIEERASDEVTRFGGKLVAPEGVRARHPAFDVTRAGYVTALFTERGIADPPGPDELERLARSPAPQA